MRTRLELQSKLEEVLESRQVYYQPPSTVKMEYPAIVYSKSNIRTTHGNDAVYSKMKKYDLIVISKRPDDPVIEKLLELSYCSYERSYKADNLNHDLLSIYI